MPKDPFHERPWAELLFYLAISAILGVLGAWRFVDDGEWGGLASAALGLVVVIIMVVMIQRKRSSIRSSPSRNANEQEFE